jgi:hypothetical protein
VRETSDTQAVTTLKDANATTARQADRAIYLGIAGVLLGLAALFVSGRKSRS